MHIKYNQHLIYAKINYRSPGAVAGDRARKGLRLRLSDRDESGDRQASIIILADSSFLP